MPATVKTREEAEAVEAIRALVLAGVELILSVLLTVGKKPFRHHFVAAVATLLCCSCCNFALLQLLHSEETSTATVPVASFSVLFVSTLLHSYANQNVYIFV